MIKGKINLEEEEDSRHENQMCPMCQMCPCMMQGMYMHPSMMYQQQPMMNQMGYPDGRDDDGEFDEDDSRDDDEDMSRRRRRRHFYPYYYGGFPHYGHMHRPRPYMY